MANNELLSMVSDDVCNWVKKPTHHVNVRCKCGNTLKKYDDTKIHEIDYCSKCDYISVCFYSQACPYNLMFMGIEKLLNTITNLSFFPTQNPTDNTYLDFYTDDIIIARNYGCPYKKTISNLYTVRELYSFVESNIKKSDTRWSIANYFQSLPDLSSVQRILDKLNPNIMPEEIVIDI